MRIEEKFNLRASKLLEVQQPIVDAKHGDALGVRVRIFQALAANDGRALAAHMTPHEALLLAEHLIAAAREKLAR